MENFFQRGIEYIRAKLDPEYIPSEEEGSISENSVAIIIASVQAQNANTNVAPFVGSALGVASGFLVTLATFKYNQLSGNDNSKNGIYTGVGLCFVFALTGAIMGHCYDVRKRNELEHQSAVSQNR